MINLPRAVRIVRQAKGMRINALAKSAGVSIPFVSLIENGYRQPSLAVLGKLAKALGIPVEVFIIASQAESGHLESKDTTTLYLIEMIQKLIIVEDDLREILE